MSGLEYLLISKIGKYQDKSLKSLMFSIWVSGIIALVFIAVLLFTCNPRHTKFNKETTFKNTTIYTK
jgi:hypothetical protein